MRKLREPLAIQSDAQDVKNRVDLGRNVQSRGEMNTYAYEKRRCEREKPS